MNDQVQGVIKGADGNHDADRLLGRKGQAPRRALGRIHGNFDARVPAQFGDSQIDPIDGTADLDARIT